MNWAAMGCWLYQDGQPDYPKLARYRVGTVYVDSRSSNAAQVIADLRTHGIAAGLYEVPQWYGSPSPSQFVGHVSRHANQLTPRVGTSEAPPLMLDLEAVSFDWIQQTVELYRKVQPRRPTSFTTEAFKWGDSIPLAACLKANLHYYVQTYRFDMSTVDDPEWAILAICRGYPAYMVHTFYAGERPPARATDGCLFTAERLP